MCENIRCTYMRENVCERDTYMHGHMRVCVRDMGRSPCERYVYVRTDRGLTSSELGSGSCR